MTAWEAPMRIFYVGLGGGTGGGFILGVNFCDCHCVLQVFEKLCVMSCVCV